MGKILEFLAKETQGECFTSYKYCYDSFSSPSIEYEDRGNDFKNLKDFAENNHDPNPRDMRAQAKSCLQNPPLFHFFLDGSRRVYKVDDIQYDKKVFPILTGQISVSCCQRIMNEDHTFNSFKHITERAYPVLCVPQKANGVGIDHNVFFNNLCNKINSQPQIAAKQFHLEKVLYYSTKLNDQETYENKGTAKIQDEMIDCEKNIVEELVKKNFLNQNQYLIKDGSIQYKDKKEDSKEKRKITNNFRHVIGVSKKFNPNLMKDSKDQSNAGQIARLPLYYRTPAFLWQPGPEWGNRKFAIWYVRIRERKWTESPYAGIVKVEKMLMTDSEVEKGLEGDEIDFITANLINERNPVCYGTDARWANHLYPIYMTECYCKNKFISDQYFLNLF